MLHRTSIHPEFDGLVQRSHGGIDAPVVIEVGEHNSTMQARHGKVSAGIRGNICEAPSLIVQHPVRLGLVHVKPTAGDKHIQPAIVVKIDKTATPATPRPAQAEQAAAGTGVLEGAFAVIAEQLKSLSVQAGHQDVGQPIAVEVSEIHSHP